MRTLVFTCCGRCDDHMAVLRPARCHYVDCNVILRAQYWAIQLLGELLLDREAICEVSTIFTCNFSPSWQFQVVDALLDNESPGPYKPNPWTRWIALRTLILVNAQRLVWLGNLLPRGHRRSSRIVGYRLADMYSLMMNWKN